MDKKQPKKTLTAAVAATGAYGRCDSVVRQDESLSARERRVREKRCVPPEPDMLSLRALSKKIPTYLLRT
jgi:hypothetical protein